ncbi:hypothetical protein CK203_051614 [Vitis vinifera]|uniref:Retrotransposon gag domain-containing protein n=1 Tax=Vitis vinifera TaxID=29760 RepID=A0A438HBH4_VITVI|nr:hypothetical protein CK203_051614 [Vitis vinifera]
MHLKQRKFFHLGLHMAFHSIYHIIEAKVERLESRMRQIRLQDGGLTWDNRDGIPAARLPTKFRMLDIEHYSGIGCPKIHLKLYNIVMRAHEIDDAQLVAIFPISLSGAAQRWFASVEPLRLRTWENVAHKFLTQFAFRTDIDVFRRELEATGQRPDEFISSFVNYWRAKVVDMIDRPKEQDQIDMVLWNLQPSKGKKPVGSSNRSGEVNTISYQHQRPALHSSCRSPIGHDTEHCAALHHAIQDLNDSGLVNLSRTSVTTNPLLMHSTHAVPPPLSLQWIDLDVDDIDGHMVFWVIPS